MQITSENLKFLVLKLVLKIDFKKDLNYQEVLLDLNIILVLNQK